MSDFSILGLSIWWINAFIIIVIFHIFVGLPNVLYLCNVYKNLFLSSKRGKLKGMEISKLNCKAYLTWIDDNIHMNNGVYFSQFERGRRDWFYRVGAYQFFKQYNSSRSVVLTAITTRFRKEIKPMNSFQVHTKLIYFDDLHIYLEQRIISSINGMVHCIAYADCSFVDKTLNKRTETYSFIKFVGITEDEKSKLINNPPQSLLHWIEYLHNSSTEIRAESGLAPKKDK